MTCRRMVPGSSGPVVVQAVVQAVALTAEAESTEPIFQGVSPFFAPFYFLKGVGWWCCDCRL